VIESSQRETSLRFAPGGGYGRRAGPPAKTVSRLPGLHAPSENERAARFYEKCGWRRVGVVVHHPDTSSGTFPLEVWRYEKRLRS
ncbi:MAG: hypothetical protein ACREON_06640, partial [Gemmatimonadaceae bacterium]